MAAVKKGLGKGLGSLLGVDAENEAEKSGQAEQIVKLRLVEPNRNQPRKNFDEGELQELADSIREHGIIQPLIVVKRNEKYEIVAGERRWRAAKIAGLTEVPIIVKDYTEKEIDEISLIENIQRKDLNPIEEAKAYRRLLDEYQMTQEELATRISKSRVAVTNTLRLLKLPEEILEQVADLRISVGHAKVLLGIEEKELAIKVAKEISAKNLSVRETEKLIKALKKNPGKTVKKEPMKNQVAYEEAEKDLKNKLGVSVSIHRTKENAGKIEIPFKTLEEFEHIVKHIE